jgi:hypothetical protein
LRCFRVDEIAVSGIHLSTVGGRLCVEVGDQQFPLGDELSQRLITTKQSVVNKLRETIERKGNGKRPFTPNELIYLDRLQGVIETEPISLMYADVGEDGTLTQERRHSAEALVLVETSAGINGTIVHKSTEFEERCNLSDRTIYREYKDSFPPAGVTVLAEGKSAQGSKCYLLRMWPRSAFRMERTGRLEGAPDFFTVVWGKQRLVGDLPLQVYTQTRLVRGKGRKR